VITQDYLYGHYSANLIKTFTAEGAESAEKNEKKSLSCSSPFSLCVLRVLCGEEVFRRIVSTGRVKYTEFVYTFCIRDGFSATTGGLLAATVDHAMLVPLHRTRSDL
jgi:hypothetical protein